MGDNPPPPLGQQAGRGQGQGGEGQGMELELELDLELELLEPSSLSPVDVWWRIRMLAFGVRGVLQRRHPHPSACPLPSS